MMKLHLVADTVPRGTTFCQKVPEEVYKSKHSRSLDHTQVQSRNCNATKS